ncbi:MAG: hypothetical protein AAF297_08065 [Planctomycetota bacterium]
MRPIRRRPARAVQLVLLAGAAVGLSTLAVAHAQPAAPATAMHQADAGAIPMTGLTLYRSGVASVQRRGTVRGNADVSMTFDADQINDVLKSMLVVDLDGGRVEGVGYESRDPLERRLASFAIDLSGDPGLTRLLSQLRGAEIELETSGGVVRGSVVGVETRPAPTGEGTTEPRPFVQILTGDGAIRGVDLTGAQGFRILDEALAQEFRMALSAIGDRGSDETKSVDLRFRGEGERDIAVAYVQEAPVWKTSYRLILPEPSEPAAGAKPSAFVQGWAIVENTTDEDWTDIDLSLVAGRPVSFTMDLYEPLYLSRPEIGVPVIASVGPKVYGRSLGRQVAPSPAAGAMMEGVSSGDEFAFSQGGLSRRMGSDAVASRASSFELGTVMQSVTSAASAESVGEVVEYRIDGPVTIERQQSAMLPIIADGIEARRVTIYSGAGQPMRGVEIANSTDAPMMAGPISVYDGERYAGDAQIDFVSTGEDRLLAYAVDLDITATSNTQSENDLRRLRIVNGVFEETRLRRQTTTHRFDSNDQARPRTLIIEQAKLGGWELVEPRTPSDTSDGLYRFELTLDPGGEASMDVTQERTTRQRVGLTTYELPTLVSLARSGKVSQDVVDAVREAGRLRGLIRETERDIEAIRNERGDIDKDQNRIRNNMGRLDRTSELFARYTRKLNEQETRLETLLELEDATEARLNERTKAYETYVGNLTVR